MKNIINYDIDFSNIPLEVKKYLYIHNDIYRGMPINKKTNEEKLVKITNKEILCEPFWDDKVTLTWDKEVDEIIWLEEKEMNNYIEKNNWKFFIFVRKSVKDILLKIDKALKEKWYILAIKIWYRPLEVQKKLFETILCFYTKKYPDLSEEEIYEKTTQMISNPNKDISPHTTWWAVDVVLYDKNKKIVDMWCPVNHIWEESHITTENISKKQRENRSFLQNVFLKYGFSSLASEWWHFSYWDPYWAKFYGKKEALYDKINL